MPDVIDAARSLGAGTIVAGIGSVAATLSHLDPGTMILIAGGVIWAIATWRRDKRQVILDNNKDLSARATIIEEERDRLVKHTADLEAELKRRPELGGLETLIRTLTEKVADGNAAIIEGQTGLTRALDRNTQAVQVWATEQAKRL